VLVNRQTVGLHIVAQKTCR